MQGHIPPPPNHQVSKSNASTLAHQGDLSHPVADGGDADNARRLALQRRQRRRRVRGAAGRQGRAGSGLQKRRPLSGEPRAALQPAALVPSSRLPVQLACALMPGSSSPVRYWCAMWLTPICVSNPCSVRPRGGAMTPAFRTSRCSGSADAAALAAKRRTLGRLARSSSATVTLPYSHRARRVRVRVQG
jgi:hypothetical protein